MPTIPNRDDLLQEVSRTVVRFFELMPTKEYQVTIREIDLDTEERSTYTHKFFVVLGGKRQYTAYVYRQATTGHYDVIAHDQLPTQEDEEEAMLILQTAAKHLRRDLATVKYVHVDEMQTPIGSSWSIRLDSDVCVVERVGTGSNYCVKE